MAALMYERPYAPDMRTDHTPQSRGSGCRIIGADHAHGAHRTGGGGLCVCFRALSLSALRGSARSRPLSRLAPGGGGRRAPAPSSSNSRAAASAALRPRGRQGEILTLPRHSHYSGVIPMVFQHSGGRDFDLPRHSHYSGVIQGLSLWCFNIVPGGPAVHAAAAARRLTTSLRLFRGCGNARKGRRRQGQQQGRPWQAARGAALVLMLVLPMKAQRPPKPQMYEHAVHVCREKI